VAAVRGITSRVDIIWRRGNMMLRRTNNASSVMINSSLIYTNTYTISLLSTDDEGREYECEVVINASPVVTATDSVALNVMGEYNFMLLLSWLFLVQFLLLWSPYHHLVPCKALWWVVPRRSSVR